MSSTRIFWTPEEIAQVAPLAAVRHMEGDCLLYQAVEDAQKILPQDRQRSFTNNHLVIQNKTLFAAIEAIKEGRALEVKCRVRKTPRPVRQKFTDYQNGFIRWSETENNKIAVAAAEFMRGGANDLVTAICLAQEKELPQGRRRSFKYSANVAKPLRQLIGTKVSTAPPLPSSEEVAPPLSWTPDPLPNVPPPAAASVDVGSAIKALDDRMAGVEYCLMRILEALDPSQSKAPQEDLQEVVNEGLELVNRHKNKRRVVLFGMYIEHWQQVSKVWGEFFNLSWVHSENNKQVSEERLRQADFVVVVTGMISHGGAQRVQRCVNKDRIIYVKSPVNDVCKALETLFARESMVAAPIPPKLQRAAAHH